MGVSALLRKYILTILRYINRFAEEKKLKGPIRKILLHIATYCTCFFSMIFFYLIFYLLVIPDVHQQATLNMVRHEKGYSARIFNLEYNFPGCKNQKLQGQELTELDKIANKICIDPFNMIEHDLTFLPETYSIKLLLDLPITDSNMALGVIPVHVELINPRNEIFELHALGNMQTKKPGLISRIYSKLKYYLGLAPSNRIIEVVLSDRFANHAFGISVININILEPTLLLNEITLQMDVVLSGIRRFMHDWFWTIAAFSIFWGSIIGYLFLIFGVGIVGLIESKVTGSKEMKKSQKIEKGTERPAEDADDDNIDELLNDLKETPIRKGKNRKFKVD